MRVLVTGAEGFIGRHLVKQLLNNDNVVLGIDRVNTHPAQTCDVTVDADVETLAAAVKDFDCIVHLAAIAAPRYAETHPAETWLVNVAGTHNVLRVAQKARVPKVVFLSSAHVYGISPRALPSREDDPLSLLDMYTTSKVMGEKLCELFYTNHGISYTTLRLFNAYGPGQSPDYFLGAKIRQAIAGDLTLRGAEVTKDWVFIEDAVDAIVRATKTAYVGPLNVGTGVEHSLEDIVRILAARFERTYTVEEDGSGGPTHMRADISRIRRVLNWEPNIPFSLGLERTIDSYL